MNKIEDALKTARAELKTKNLELTAAQKMQPGEHKNRVIARIQRRIKELGDIISSLERP